MSLPLPVGSSSPPQGAAWGRVSRSLLTTDASVVFVPYRDPPRLFGK